MITLKLSTFKDITAFVLAQIAEMNEIVLDVNYVKNADEAHQDLISGKMQIVCMSYDDVLSIYHEKNYTDILSIAPIHGGMLSLCGKLFSYGKLRIAIDTDSGYARLLRDYLASNTYDIEWVFAGATNIRAKKLMDHEFDATLLNPPFCYHSQINIIDNLTDNNSYQGMVFSMKKSFYQTQQSLVDIFLDNYYQTVRNLLANQSLTIKKLQVFYDINEMQAKQTFDRINSLGGLSTNDMFNRSALEVTEDLFTKDTKIAIIPSYEWMRRL